MYKKKSSDVTRHVPPTQLLLTICASCASAVSSLHHAMQGCKPQSVKSCGATSAPIHKCTKKMSV